MNSYQLIRKHSAMKKGFTFVMIYLASIASTYLLLTRTHSCDTLNHWFFSDLSSLQLASETAKWTLLRSLLAKIALYLFAHAALIMTIRIFTAQASPATEEDSTAIKVLNRIITNTIEQSIIFVSLYAYFVFDRAGDRFTDNQLIAIASWYLLARLLFSATYLLGYLVGYPNLRAFGFAINVAVLHLLIELSFTRVTYFTDFVFGK